MFQIANGGLGHVEVDSQRLITTSSTVSGEKEKIIELAMAMKIKVHYHACLYK